MLCCCCCQEYKHEDEKSTKQLSPDKDDNEWADRRQRLSRGKRNCSLLSPCTCPQQHSCCLLLQVDQFVRILRQQAYGYAPVLMPDMMSATQVEWSDIFINTRSSGLNVFAFLGKCEPMKHVRNDAILIRSLPKVMKFCRQIEGKRLNGEIWWSKPRVKAPTVFSNLFEMKFYKNWSSK